MIDLPTSGNQVRNLPFADGNHGADRRQPICQLVETHDELATRCLQGVGNAVARRGDWKEAGRGRLRQDLTGDI
jgi:hypothetical protein